MSIFVWVFIAIMFILLELILSTFSLIWLGIGAIIAGVLNYFGFDIYFQFCAFVVVSLVLILFSRKFALKITPEPSKKTTSDRLVGEKGVIVRKLNDGEGIIKVLGEEWSAFVPDDADVGDKVKVVSIKSIKLVTEKV